MYLAEESRRRSQGQFESIVMTTMKNRSVTVYNDT